MSDPLEQNDPAIEELMKDALTNYMLDSLDIEDRLRAAVRTIALKLLTEELAALRERAGMAKASHPRVGDTLKAA